MESEIINRIGSHDSNNRHLFGKGKDIHEYSIVKELSHIRPDQAVSNDYCSCCLLGDVDR